MVKIMMLLLLPPPPKEHKHSQEDLPPTGRLPPKNDDDGITCLPFSLMADQKSQRGSDFSTKMVFQKCYRLFFNSLRGFATEIVPGLIPLNLRRYLLSVRKCRRAILDLAASCRRTASVNRSNLLNVLNCECVASARRVFATLTCVARSGLSISAS